MIPQPYQQFPQPSPQSTPRRWNGGRVTATVLLALLVVASLVAGFWVVYLRAPELVVLPVIDIALRVLGLVGVLRGRRMVVVLYAVFAGVVAALELLVTLWVSFAYLMLGSVFGSRPRDRWIFLIPLLIGLAWFVSRVLAMVFALRTPSTTTTQQTTSYVQLQGQVQGAPMQVMVVPTDDAASQFVPMPPPLTFYEDHK